jgi:hypothetical protein
MEWMVHDQTHDQLNYKKKRNNVNKLLNKLLEIMKIFIDLD